MISRFLFGEGVIFSGTFRGPVGLLALDNDHVITPSNAHNVCAIGGGGVATFDQQQNEAFSITPHARTLRKARENVKWMVKDGVSHRKTRNYLHRFVLWWQKTSNVWHYEELLHWFISTCWELKPAAIAASLLQTATLQYTDSSCDRFRLLPA